MVHYHGGPFSDPVTAVVVWRGRHAMISFARPDQIRMAADICQSFCLDNGAYSVCGVSRNSTQVGIIRGSTAGSDIRDVISQ